MKKSVIYCDAAFKKAAFQNKDIEVVSSPLSCIDLAETINPELIIVRFPCIELDNRVELVKLCEIIEKNRFTRKIKVIGLIKYFHRALIAELDNYHIEYIDVWDGAGSAEDKISEIIDNQDKLSTPRELIARSCPYLIYEKISVDDEIILCEAYRSRMVVNSLRLKTLCSLEKHERCDYFINPRFRT